MALQALHGFIYLKRPEGPPAAQSCPSTRVTTADSPSGNTASAPSAQQQPSERSLELNYPRREDIGRLLILWLESVDGRRSPRSLKNGRFHPDILGQLGGHQRLIQAGGGNQTGAVASKIKTLHIQKTTTPTVRFCASAVIGGRVRAIAGTTKLVRLPKKEGSPRPTQKQWRVETLQII